MKTRPPLRGYNHNLRHLDRTFHVQTEDSGLAKLHIFTHLFHGGTIISSKRTDYLEEDADEDVQKLMQEQHKDMLKGLRTGSFNERIQKLLGGTTETGSTYTDAELARIAEDAADHPAPISTRDTQEEIAQEIIDRAMEAPDSRRTTDPGSARPAALDEQPILPLGQPEPPAPPAVSAETAKTIDTTPKSEPAAPAQRTPTGKKRRATAQDLFGDAAFLDEELENAVLLDRPKRVGAPLPEEPIPLDKPKPPRPPQRAFVPGAATAAVLAAADDDTPGNSTVFDTRVPDEVLRLIANRAGEPPPPPAEPASPGRRRAGAGGVAAPSAEGVVARQPVIVGSRATLPSPRASHPTPLPTAATKAPSSYNEPGSIFGEASIEATLDEAILAYLSDEPAKKK